MKKTFSLLLLLWATFSSVAQDFKVNKYTVDIHLSEEGYFDVVENYNLNFDTYKHGIYRTIQTNYELINAEGTKEKRRIKIKNIEVPNYKFQAPFEFIQKISNNINIKIGDKNKTLIGPQHYQIKYRVYNAFFFEKDFIKFYWNIKPDGWMADFHQINFKIHVPENVELGVENCFVYSGPRGTTTLSNDIETDFQKNTFSGTSIANSISRPGENVTVLINLPLQSIKEIKPLWPFWNQYGWLFIIAALVGGFYRTWKKYGKDDKVTTTTSYYPPENIDPAMAGFLMDDKSDSSDIISLLPYWGAKGLLKIEEIPKKGLFSTSDTKLIRLKSLPDDAPVYEQIIFNGLFDGSSSLQLSSKGKTLDILNSILGKENVEINPGEVLVSSLKNTFYITMNSASSALKDNAQKYYEAASKKVQTITWVVLALSAIILTLIGLFFWGIIAAIAIVVTSVVLIILNFYMAKKNRKGTRLFSELKGFKRFIKVAEENKLKMLLAEDPGYFENTMGYALAFGLFKKWAEKFDSLHIPPPNWYSSGTNQMNMHHFARSFSTGMNSVKATMVSSPSSSGGSSGGGSSGGGFGGGGGGSW
ncbi:MAG: DUF2207 domain-containing protein [Flavobacteriaceae bacterium]|nr:DUF2207 domain-containing protein [Flavobacteriaceae bacterium]